MKLVRFKKSVALEMGSLKFTYTLPAGRDYLFFDGTVKQIEESGHSFESRSPAGEIAFYSREPLDGKSLLFASLGGYGDVLCLVQALNALQSRYPGAGIDLAVAPDQYALAKAFSFRGGWLPPPLRLGALKRYDYLQSSEALRGLEGHDYDRDNVARMFFDLFSLPLDLGHSPYRAGVDRASSAGIPKRVAIQVDALWGSNRAYPARQMADLAALLAGKGWEVFLTGFHRGFGGTNGSGRIHNLINRLPSVLDLVALLAGMDAIVSPDSLSAHLGGMLGLPTVALFSVTGAHKLDHYPSVRALASGLPCSPCYQLFKCPRGLESCAAFEDAAVAPARVLEEVERTLEES